MSPGEQWHITLDAARHYERVVARHLLGRWAPLLADAARLAPGERVLDLACGTGVVTRVAAQRVGREGRVTGVDINAGMVAVARSLPAPDGARIDWLDGSAMAIPMPDAAVDAVLCQQGFQFFLDQALALREMRRVLARGGRLALSVWSGTGHYNGAVGEALARFAGADAASRFLASRKVPAKDEIERLVAAAGFTGVAVQVARLDVHLPRIDAFVLEHLAGTPVAASVAALDESARRDIGAGVARALRRFEDGDGVTYPEETHVATARA